MFEDVKKCLDEYENIINELNGCSFHYELSKEKEDYLDYFELHLAKAIMTDRFINAEKVAKIILAAKGLSNEIKVKVE